MPQNPANFQFGRNQRPRGILYSDPRMAEAAIIRIEDAATVQRGILRNHVGGGLRKVRTVMTRAAGALAADPPAIHHNQAVEVCESPFGNRPSNASAPKYQF